MLCRTGEGDCFTLGYSCRDHTCGYSKGPGFCTGTDSNACVLREGAIGGENCTRMVEECERKKQEDILAGRGVYGVCGTFFTPLTDVSATAGISLQVSSSSRGSGSSCSSGQCRTRAGRCCQPVWLRERYICPIYC